MDRTGDRSTAAGVDYHALVGVLIGAGLLANPQAVQWQSLAATVALPLLASAVAAYLLSALLGGLLRRRAHDLDRLWPIGSQPPRRPRPSRLSRFHWLSAGAVGAARGLNDTPKIAAVAGFALIPAGVPVAKVVAGVAAAMAAGSLMAGGRVARRLGEC